MNFTMDWDVSGIQARTLFDELESTQSAINEDAPSAGLAGFQVNWQGADSGSKWMQMRTDEVMQTSAFQGCIISVVFAIVVLAIATANHILMLEHAIYTVASPEAAASILWRDSEKKIDAATNMKITAQDLKELGIIDSIIAEPVGGAHRDPRAVIAKAGDKIAVALKEFADMSADEIRKHRHDRFLDIGRNL